MPSVCEKNNFRFEVATITDRALLWVSRAPQGPPLGRKHSLKHWSRCLGALLSSAGGPPRDSSLGRAPKTLRSLPTKGPFNIFTACYVAWIDRLVAKTFEPFQLVFAGGVPEAWCKYDRNQQTPDASSQLRLNTTWQTVCPSRTIQGWQGGIEALTHLEHQGAVPRARGRAPEPQRA